MSSYKNILKNVEFSKLYAAGLVSELGSFITETALMLFIFKLSNNNNAYLGITRAVFLIFLTFGGIIGGVIGELFDRKKILIFSNLIRIPILCLILFFDNLYIIILANGLIAFFTGIFNPSRQTLINEIVAKKDINQANSLFGVTLAILHLLGPVLGAAIFSMTGSINPIISLDLMTYVLGISLLLSLRYKKTPVDKKTQAGFIQELKNGINYIKKRDDLKALFLNCAVAGFSIGILIPLLLPYILNVLHGTENDFGIAMSAFGLGGIVGGFLCSKLVVKFSTGKVTFAALCLEPVIMLLWLLSTNIYLNLSLFVLWGVLVFIRIPAQLNYLSETVPVGYLTRMHSLLDLSFVIPHISGGLMVAFLSEKINIVVMLQVSCAFFFLFTFPRFFTKNMQYLLNNNLRNG